MKSRGNSDKPEHLGPEHIFKLFSNPMKIRLFLLVAHRLYTLRGLSKRLDRPRSTLCGYLTEFRNKNLVENVDYKASVRYKVIRRELIPILRKTIKAAERINRDLGLADR